MSLRERTRPGLGTIEPCLPSPGTIEPCLPSPAKAPPSGPGWVHEFKHDGIRILACRDSAGVRLITRTGNDFSSRFPFIAMAVGKLPVRSCLIDGEAIVCNENGLAVYELIRRHDACERAVLSAFDLLELDGKDLRRKPIENRKQLLAGLLNGSLVGIVFNECFGEDGAIVFREACRLDCVETAWLDLSPGPLASLAESQKPECASGEAGSRGGLGALMWGPIEKKQSRPMETWRPCLHPPSTARRDAMHG
jgi:ATP-dependent DNA ligase